ncbi:hypothetical protein P7K49_008519 [Saguinus oedipus]|uniref:Uncharacterized protein n=1 Tax=Saguinus oedipus TaxID=9490 RepID=A0ABQ9VXY9_SAGOE|nr:hypothetical protein P7K49_008519 [Saguinus oedipus]
MLNRSHREMAQFVLTQRRKDGVRKPGPDCSKRDEKGKNIEPSHGTVPKVPQKTKTLMPNRKYHLENPKLRPELRLVSLSKAGIESGVLPDETGIESEILPSEAELRLECHPTRPKQRSRAFTSNQVLLFHDDDAGKGLLSLIKEKPVPKPDEDKEERLKKE